MAASWYAAAAGHGLSAAALKLVGAARGEASGHRIACCRDLTLAPAVPTGPPVAPAWAQAKSVQIELSRLRRRSLCQSSFCAGPCTRHGRAHRAFTSFSKDSRAVLVWLPRVPADYAWRIYTVAASVPDYAPSASSYSPHADPRSFRSLMSAFGRFDALAFPSANRRLFAQRGRSDPHFGFDHRRAALSVALIWR